MVKVLHKLKYFTNVIIKQDCGALFKKNKKWGSS